MEDGTKENRSDREPLISVDFQSASPVSNDVLFPYRFVTRPPRCQIPECLGIEIGDAVCVGDWVKRNNDGDDDDDENGEREVHS